MAEQWWRTNWFRWIAACLGLVVGGLAVLAGGLAAVAAVQSNSGPARGSAISASDVTTALDGFLRETGQVTGRVTGTDGQPLGGIKVGVATAPFRSWSTGPGKPSMPPGPTWEGTTDEDGRYRVDEVSVGPHRVVFSGRGYASVFNGGALDIDDADDVQVEENAATEVDAVLAQGGQISGRVTRKAGGAVGRDVPVEAVLVGSEQSTVSAGLTRARGRYALKGLTPGRWVVRVVDPRSGVVHHPAVIAESSATVLEIEEGQRIAEIDIAVPEPAVITGRVLSQQGAPMPGVLVQVNEGIQDMGRYGAAPIGYEKVRTDGAGRYRLEKPTSTLSLWAGEAGAPGACEDVVDSVEGLRVEAGRTFVQDLRAPVPAGISGRITDTDGRALRDIAVLVEGTDTSCYEEMRTDRAGNYSVAGLRPGKYQVRVGHSSGEPSGYFEKFYGGSADFGSARKLRLRPGQVRDRVDVALEKGGRITGRVTLRPEVRLDELSVWASHIPESGVEYVEVPGVVEEDGRFSVIGLRPGKYRLNFTPTFPGVTSGATESPRIFHTEGGSSFDTEDAEPIDVRPGRATRGVKVRLDLGASISGTLVNDQGEPRPDIEVVAHRRGPTAGGDTGWVSAVSSWTDARGRYSIRGLLPGTYRIGFAGSEYYPDVTDVEDARDLELDSGEALRRIDAELVFDWE